ncbi:MAG: putative membrane protein [Paracoccaceae bacterium]|jgi:uncharacterized membrane protein
MDASAAILFLGAPALILLVVHHVELARKLGTIVLCYVAGMQIGLSGLLPEGTNAIRTSVTEASLGLALPLLLFSVDIQAWRHVAGRAMLSMFLAITAVVFISTVLFYSFQSGGVQQPEHLAGMAVGMYTGGLANLGAIKLALDIPDTRYLLFATIDTVVGALYLIFVLTIAPRIFGRFLRPFPDQYRISGTIAADADSYSDLLRRAAWPAILIALIAAGVCVAIAVTLAPSLKFSSPQIMVIVLLTSLGLLASFIPMIRNNQAAPKMGMYLIYVFSFCVAASMDLNALAGMDLSILGFVVAATFGSLLLHALLCRLFKIDVDTFIITSVAALMSPAFVPMVARSLGNPAILMSGMTTGILGFAIGNYLGISVALLLASGGTQ